jgi:hypothetical protein
MTTKFGNEAFQEDDKKVIRNLLEQKLGGYASYSPFLVFILQDNTSPFVQVLVL